MLMEQCTDCKSRIKLNFLSGTAKDSAKKTSATTSAKTNVGGDVFFDAGLHNAAIDSTLHNTTETLVRCCSSD